MEKTEIEKDLDDSKIKSIIMDASDIFEKRSRLGLTRTPDFIKGDMHMVEYLLGEIDGLRQEISKLEAEAVDTWMALEDVAIGASIQCPKCGKYKPCLCEHMTNENK